MKISTMTVGLNKAREWYKSSIPELKELALALFNEKDLEPVKSITTFDDVLNELGIDFSTLVKDCKTPQESNAKIVEAINVALTGNFRDLKVGDIMYYPVVSLTRSFKEENNTVIVDEIPYEFICTTSAIVVGKDIIPHPELLCSSLEVATQMGKYFAKEVFNLCYYDVLSYKYKNEIKH